MSIGGDEYDEQGRTGGAGTSTRRAPARGTRTRLPGEDGDVYGVGRRPAGRPGRSLLMVVSVVVLLIAAIAFANRSGSSGSEGEENDPGGGPAAQPTAPSGQTPVQTEDGTTGIPSGFPQTEQGAQSAAANYAVALGGDRMYGDAERAEIVRKVYTPETADRRLQELDKVYNDTAFLKRIGLEDDGTAPDGLTFVSRTSPVGAKIVNFDQASARVAVWYSALFGLAGPNSKTPVTESWYTNTFDLQWVDGDWKILDFTQIDGPVPVGRDQRASSAEEMTDAVEGFGGFTYAR
ncbi:hypothetical protein RM572_07585 [Streptomyces sp. DSM 42041]|uniref:DUF8175 domain-containing protein n=1 Tax=Streptomyces hazeniae TaxID=3075538 RepID=A0ABU2NNT7_9ACTN|nr:hypothetical protein [Streptomyces sp. DSM 42041]MDT0378641.1 hypothetical protein [Streptomyces sp. DSM 42041]